MPLIPVLGRLRQVDPYECKTRMVYKASPQHEETLFPKTSKGGREGGRRETDRAKRILNRKPALARE